MSGRPQAIRSLLIALAFTSPLALAPSAHADICSNLVAWWSFDEGSGTAAQDVAGQVDDDGFLMGPYWTAGFSGTALSFDGVDDRVEVPLSADLTTNSGLSIAAWVNVDPDASGVAWIASTYLGNGYYLRLDLAASDIEFYARGNLSGSYAIPRGRWIHITGTYSSATTVATIYVNGQLIVSQPMCHPGPCSPNAPVAPLTIGSFMDGSGSLDGQIDELRIYDRELTPDDIAELAGASTLDQGIAAQWNLDEGTGVTTEDISGVTDDGNLVGGPLWATGYRGRALNFDGVNDRVEVPLSSDLTTPAGLTLSAWVNVDPSATGVDWIVSTYSGSGYYLRLNLDGSSVEFGARGPMVRAYAIPRSTWVHLAGTYETATGVAKFYVNGISIGTQQMCSPDCPPDAPAVPLTIGSSNGGVGSLDGRIDEVRVYRRALSPDEVAQLFAPLSLTRGLVANWCFNEGAGTAARDIAGSVGDDGNLNGPSWNPGHEGTALKFDGVNDRVQAPLSAHLTMSAGLSICAWVYVNPSASGTDWIVSTFNSTGYYLRLNLGTPGIEMYARGGSIGSYVIPRSKWVHVAGTFDAATGVFRIYADGELLRTQRSCFANPCPPEAPAVPLTIGSFTDGTGSLDGMIDEVHVYSRALSTREVRQLAGQPIVGVEPAAPTFPAHASISAISPNPSSAAAVIRYELPLRQHIRLGITDVAGRLVRTLEAGVRDAGTHTLKWDGLGANGKPMAPGVYFCRLEGEGQRHSRALVRIR